jgi:porin
VDAQLGQVGGARLDGYLRVGMARDRFNGVGSYVGSGLVMASPFPARPDDQFGLSIASAGTGAALRDAAALLGSPLERRETTLELTWRAPIRDWLTLQPDLQYVKNPGFDPALDDAWVVGLRFELSGSFER